MAATMQAETRTVPIGERCRSRRRRLRRQSRAAQQQCYRVYLVRVQHRGEMAGVAKEFAPKVMRVAVLRDPTSAAGIGQFAAIQAVAWSVGVELNTIKREELQERKTGAATQIVLIGVRRLTRTNPKTLCGPKRPPAHRALELRRGYFPPVHTRDRPGPAAPDRSTGHSP